MSSSRRRVLCLADMPQDIVYHILLQIEDAQSYRHASCVCREWRWLCHSILWEQTRMADELMERRTWQGAEDVYKAVLAKNPLFLPAMLGLRAYLRHTNGRWDVAEELIQRAKSAHTHAKAEAARFYEQYTETGRTQTDEAEEDVVSWSRKLHAHAHGWFLRAVWLDQVMGDPVEAAVWFRRSAERGHAAAQCSLGYCYDMGEGVPQDVEEAIEWYRRSADGGYTQALHNLGVCYERGEGVPQNQMEAVRLYQLAADRGNAAAQCNLGFAYDMGMGVPMDRAKAFIWYHESAERGNPVAQFNLGNCYLYGWGVKRDLASSIRSYEQAAAQGHVEADTQLKTLRQFHKTV